MSDGNNITRTDNVFLHTDNAELVMYNANADLTMPEDDVLYETDDWPAYLTWIQKVFSSLSIVCSYVICREVLSDLKNQRTNSRSSSSRRKRNAEGGRLQQSIARILLNLSVSDILFSLAVFLGEWPAPKDTLYIHHAAGNQQFCTFQGWLRALGYLASPMFSVGLNTLYLLLIRYRWQDSDLSRLEKKVTIGIWTYAMVLSIIPIPLQAYNSDWDVCWIVPSPLDCVGDECTRGVMANKLEIFYSFVHIWTCVVVCVILMILLFRTVKHLEDKSRSYNFASTGKQILKDEAPEMKSHEEEHPSMTSKFDCECECTSETSQPIENGEEPSVATTKKVRISFAPGVMESPMTPAEAADVETPTCPKEAPRGDVDRSRSQSLDKKSNESRFSVSSYFSKLFFPTLQSNNYRKSRAVAYQGILYTLAFMSTHLFDMIASIIWKIDQMWNLYFDIVAYMVMQPALGILNFLIFSRNRKRMATPEGRWLRKIFFCCSCACCSRSDKEETKGSFS